jgi:hypothetical protein
MKKEEHYLDSRITAYHPDDKHIIYFDEGPHTYIDNFGVKYESCTTFLGRYFEKFDAVSMSESCSKGDDPKYKGRKPIDIRNEWTIKGVDSSDEGSNVHLYGEGKFSGWEPYKLPIPKTPRCNKLFQQIDRCHKDLMRYYKFIAAEMIVFFPPFKKSGMIDLLLWSRASNEIVIADFKTNVALENLKVYKKAYKPIHHLDDTKINKYALQLSFYQLILKLGKYFPGVKGYRRIIIHLIEDNYKIIPVEEYGFEINELLKYEGLK